MASQNRFLVDWIKGAYGMELGLAPMLEQQASKLDSDTELHRSLTHHLGKTRRHASLLRERLEEMEEDVSSVRPIDPITTSLGRVDGGRPDPARQTELLDYVTESFEVASYRALRSLAEMLGDVDTSRICETILADELAISSALSGRLPGHNGHMDTPAAAIQGNVLLAHEVFAALNAHDLDRYDRLLSDRYRAEIPGDVGPVSRDENRSRLEMFFRALPDFRYQLNRVSATGDTVFVEWDASGTHAGPFLMMEGSMVPPTNKIVRLSGVTILRLENGMLTHSRVVSDTASLMRQLGVMPGARTTIPQPGSAGRDLAHLEIPASERAVAARFYNALFGWEYDREPQTSNYTGFKAGRLEGGFANASEKIPAGKVMIYIQSNDIDDDLKKAESLGGRTIVPRTELPGYGWYGVLSDPDGNHIGLVHEQRPA